MSVFLSTQRHLAFRNNPLQKLQQTIFGSAQRVFDRTGSDKARSTSLRTSSMAAPGLATNAFYRDAIRYSRIVTTSANKHRLRRPGSAARATGPPLFVFRDEPPSLIPARQGQPVRLRSRRGYNHSASVAVALWATHQPSLNSGINAAVRAAKRLQHYASRFFLVPTP